MKKNIISIHLKNKESYLNKYNDKKLSNDLINYILDESDNSFIKQKIEFIITSDFKFEEKEKNDFVDVLRNSFGTNISEIIHFSKKEIVANSLIFLAGIIFLIIYFLLNINFLSEFTLIFGWLFIGESMCNILYKGIKNRLKIIRRKQIVNAKIFFK